MIKFQCILSTAYEYQSLHLNDGKERFKKKAKAVDMSDFDATDTIKLMILQPAT